MRLNTQQVSGDHLLPPAPASVQKQPPHKPPQDQPLKCPRCASTKTKFCYYNNYNKSQPRHFCKGCKRHWTAGGTLRNVPVGGGRKNHGGSFHKRLIKTDKRAAPAAPAAACDQEPPAGTDSINGVKITNVDPSSPLVPRGNDIKVPSFPVPSSNFCYFDSDIIHNWVEVTQLDDNNLSSLGNYAYSDIIGEFDYAEESAITTLMPFTSCNNTILSHQPYWKDEQEEAMDITTFWSLGDIDSLVSADLNNTPWDDLEIKPKGNS
ncbi:unnamed protein product [Cuscuta epithymum]|uniref:Dof-type domain-containing protein n=1 Tax=Cuscuta epithymum TaxID=186058 RepID=A0AAV0CRE4_9ASTE|nr:unnamed protein product [Cuscuta epithymum]